jgi:hypothetical protein
MQVVFEFSGAGILAAIVLGVATSTAWEKGWPKCLSSGARAARAGPALYIPCMPQHCPPTVHARHRHACFDDDLQLLSCT